MKKVYIWILLLSVSATSAAQKRATRHISTTTTIERTVLTMSAEQKAVHDSVEYAQEQERIGALNLLRMREEQEAQKRRQEEEQEKLKAGEAEKKRLEKEQKKQAQEDIARQADSYYIAWLIKTQSLDNIYRDEILAKFDMQAIMRLVNEYSKEELGKKAQGYHMYLSKYKK